MNRLLCTLALAVLAAAPAAAQGPDTRGIVRVTKSLKVTAPVVVEILPQPDPAPGVRRVRIVARPSVDAAQMTIDVAAESGLSLREPASWTVPLRAGEELVRELDVAVTGPGELRLVVTATVKYGDDFTQSGIHVFAFNPSPESGGALTKSFVPSVPNQPGGRTILEVPARTP
jgi:hypothetical protein